MKLITKYIFTILFLTLLSILAVIFHHPAPLGVGVYVLDVGQGDSILIEKDNYQILIDGGPDDKVLSEIGKVMPLNDHKIETVILTHPHADHITGLNLILDRYEIGKIYSSGVIYSTDQYLSFLQKIKDKHIAFEVPAKKEMIIPFENGTLQFLWPGDDYKDKTAENMNDSSVLSKFCYFKNCILLTGDMEADEQNKMLSYYKDDKGILAAQILKYPHHGSSNGTNQPFFEAVNPLIAVISCGLNNSYGHPNPSALALIAKENTKLWRTDKEGTAMFLFTEQGIFQNGKDNQKL